MTKISNLYGLTNYVTANSSGNVVIAAPTSGTALYVTGSAQVTGQLTLGSTITNGTYTYTLPSATGTLALASSLGSYLPLTGGTLTGALIGTTANFSNSFSNTSDMQIVASGNIAGINIRSSQGGRFTIAQSYVAPDVLSIFTSTGTSNPSVEAIRIANGTGAATFSSSVNATSLALNGSLSNSGDAGLLTIKQSSQTATNGIYIERGGERNGYYMYIGGSVDSLNFRRNYFGTQSDTLSLTRDGLVGIGTSTPNSTLAISISAYSNAGPKGYTLDNTAGFSAYVNSQDPYTGYLDIYATRSGDGGTLGGSVIRFLNQTTSTTASAIERMRITSDGLLQFSTTSVVPTTNNVIYSYSSNGYMYIQGGTTGLALMGSGNRNNGIYVNTTNNEQYFYSNNSERIRLTDAGRLLIGATSSVDTLTRLRLNYAADSCYLDITSGAGDAALRLGGSYGQITNTTGALYISNQGATGDMIFRTGSTTERMRITSGGRVGIGISSPGAALQVAQPGVDDQLILGSTANNRDHAMFMCSGPNQAEIIRYQSGVRLILAASTSISNVDVIPGGTNGVRLSAGNTSWSAYTSDARRKKNFESVPGLDAIMQVEPVKYHFNTQNDTEVKKLGFTAQNLLPLIPEMVHPNGEKEDDGTDTLTIIPDYILPVLVQAIKDQQAQIEELKQLINN